MQVQTAIDLEKQLNIQVNFAKEFIGQATLVLDWKAFS